MFEVLNGPLMLLGRRATLERSEVPPLPGFRIGLSRVEPVLTGFQFANHGGGRCNRCAGPGEATRLGLKEAKDLVESW